MKFFVIASTKDSFDCTVHEFINLLCNDSAQWAICPPKSVILVYQPLIFIDAIKPKLLDCVLDAS